MGCKVTLKAQDANGLPIIHGLRSLARPPGCDQCGPDAGETVKACRQTKLTLK
jgi:hypothetical protein